MRGEKAGIDRLRSVAIGVIILAASIVTTSIAPAQDEGGNAPPGAPPPVGAPATPVIPDLGAPLAAPPVEPPAASKAKHHRTTHRASVGHFDLEEASARLQLSHDTTIYASPSTSARQLEPGIAGKFVQVTGVTRHWLRVNLKNGETGYVQQKDVNLVKPTDKIFALTKDAAVRAEPNQWAKQVSEVHREHNVHVIGIALYYMKIRMRSGLEGYIPTTALE
ncbi:MAG TPA: hypothetical protein VMD75_10295 [Candidatus Binataceae bacterium]|nr:hypothetical protein [Candidatus Binataceae bacterium]